MENNYKRLADVDVVEAVEDSAHVLVEVDGEIKKTAKSNVGGGSGGGAGKNPYILVTEEDPDSGDFVIHKEVSVLPTFAALMEYFNNRQIFRLTTVHTSSYNGTTIAEGSRLNHVTEFNGNDCNAMSVGNGEWTAYVTDDNEILTEGEMNQKYPDTRE
jgi:hypothetical protein